MATRKGGSPSIIKDSTDLGLAIELAASNIGKLSTLKIAIPGAAASVKVATDRARRIPRLKGLQAVSVSVLGFDKGVCELQIAASPEVATPWPTKAAPAPAKAAKRSTAKAKPASNGAFKVGQKVEFAANRCWYPGKVVKVGKSTVTVTYVKGSGVSYTATVNPATPFRAGGQLGDLPSRVRAGTGVALVGKAGAAASKA